MNLSPNRNQNPGWLFAFGSAIVAAYAFCFMEWLFFVTKPSFLSALGWVDRLTILGLAPLAIAAPMAGWGLICRGIGLLGLKANRFGLLVFRLAVASLISAILLLAVDNFTLTVLGAGIRSTSGSWSLAYGVAWGAVFLLVIWRLSLPRQRRASNSIALAGILCLGASLSLLAVRDTGFSPQPQVGESSRSSGSFQPNILLLSSDGLSASHLSAYGYSRDTTPFLRQLKKESLFCENAFSNAASTGGSITSLLTGKLPTVTRVLYPPEILRGKDAFEHLPAILRGRGYRTFHRSIRHYADPIDMNFQESFDDSNGQRRKNARIIRSAAGFLGIEPAYFLGQSWDRLTSRLLHLGQIREMTDVYAEVTQSRRLRDQESVAQLLYFLEHTREPFFAQIHLMGTHGPKFRLENPVYSKGETQAAPWMTDFYDDAILTFDGYVAEIINFLRDRKELDRTIVVIHSDHAQRFEPGARIPLLFRFPNGLHAGEIRPNTQLLDVAPTLLDYLGGGIPAWMTGRSLISAALNPLEPIFFANPRFEIVVAQGNGYEIDPAEANPPFYSLGHIRAIVCNRLYTLDLTYFEFFDSVIENHTEPCPDTALPKPEDVQQILIAQLASEGYDVSSIGAPPLARRDLYDDIRSQATRMQSQGVPNLEIQSRAWETWGGDVVRVFNQKKQAGKPIPVWLQQMIDWADEHSRIEVVERDPVMQLRIKQP